MSIRARILKGFIIVVIIGAMLGAIGVVSSRMLLARADELFYYQKESAKFSEILNAHYAWRYNLTNAVISGTEFTGSLNPDTCALGKWLESEAALNENDPQILSLLAEIREPHNRIHQGAAYIIDMVNEGDLEGAQAYLTNGVTSNLNAVIAGLSAIGVIYNEKVVDEINNIDDLGTLLPILSISITVVAVVVALWLSFAISGSISKPLSLLSSFMKKAGETGDLTLSPEDVAIIQITSKRKDELGQAISGSSSFITHVKHIAEELEAIADGDLTTKVEVLSESDTLGVSLRRMEDNLNRMFGEIRTSSDQVTTGAKQVADGAQALAQGASMQAAVVQELSSSISEIADKTQTNAARANKTSKLSSQIKEYAEKGSRQMDDMIVAVDDINEASVNISKIIKTIDDIAFQTNILALNAAVEAARSGQHGKVFAVVAEEVRNLASKSALAAKDTGDMIQNSMEKAELGSRIAGETASSLKEIVSGINESSLLISDIANASEEQSTNISHINTGINQVVSVIQQNSATAQESAAASEEMSSQSSVLQQLISQFNLSDSNDIYQALSMPTYAQDDPLSSNSRYRFAS